MLQKKIDKRREDWALKFSIISQRRLTEKLSFEQRLEGEEASRGNMNI